MSKEKIAGILGGMGPEATADLLSRIVSNTPARDDNDHIRCIIDSNAKVPSRIKAILEGGPNPGPVLADMAKRLEAWGADFLAMPCNTAHHYLGYITDAVSIPMLDMIEIAIAEALKVRPDARRVGILCTPATHKTGLYTRPLEARGLEATYADPDYEDALLKVIMQVKSGNTGKEPREGLAAIVRHVRGKGADICITACTELGIVLEPYGDVPVVDAAESLAKAIVRTARHQEGFSSKKQDGQGGGQAAENPGNDTLA